MPISRIVQATVVVAFLGSTVMAQSQRGWGDLARDQLQGLQNWQPTEMPFELALKQASECVQRSAKELDDRMSDAATIGKAVLFSCLRERRLAVNAFQVREKRYSGETGVAIDLQKAEENELQAVVIGILRARVASR